MASQPSLRPLRVEGPSSLSPTKGCTGGIEDYTRSHRCIKSVLGWTLLGRERSHVNDSACTVFHRGNHAWKGSRILLYQEPFRGGRGVQLQVILYCSDHFQKVADLPGRNPLSSAELCQLRALDRKAVVG